MLFRMQRLGVRCLSNGENTKQKVSFVQYIKFSHFVGFKREKLAQNLN